MLDTSKIQERLFAIKQDGKVKVKCGKKGRSTGKKCGCTLLINDKIADQAGHEFSLAELVNLFFGGYSALWRTFGRLQEKALSRCSVNPRKTRILVEYMLKMEIKKLGLKKDDLEYIYIEDSIREAELCLDSDFTTPLLFSYKDHDNSLTYFIPVLNREPFIDEELLVYVRKNGWCNFPFRGPFDGGDGVVHQSHEWKNKILRAVERYKVLFTEIGNSTAGFSAAIDCTPLQKDNQIPVLNILRKVLHTVTL